MKQDRSILWLGRILAVLVVAGVVAGIVALDFYLPLIAAILFIALVTVAAVARGKSEGFWNGLRLFLKDILFGW